MRHSGAALLAGWLLVAAGCGKARQSAPLPPAAPHPRVARARERTVELVLAFVGRVEASQRVQLRALVEGRVIAVGPADGALVRRGELVFKLGGPRLRARGEELEVQVAAAKKGLQAEREQLVQARHRAQAHLAVAGEVAGVRRELAALEGALGRAREARERFQLALEIKAPLGGRFVARRVSPGQDVKPGELLGTLLDPDSRRISALVLPRGGRVPAPGQEARVERRGEPPLLLHVVALRPLASPGGALRVWLAGQELASLALGTVVRGEIVAAVRQHALTVPPEALVRDQQDRPLIYVGQRAPFARRRVTLGVAGPGFVEIRSGLAPQEELVVAGAYALYWADFARRFKLPD